MLDSPRPLEFKSKGPKQRGASQSGRLPKDAVEAFDRDEADVIVAHQVIFVATF
jgi:hypothetical protein